MDLNTWYEKGLTEQEYIATLEDHEEAFLNIYNNFSVQDDSDFLKQLRNKNLRIIALAEVWCGHCMLNIPILLRLAEKADIPVRFLPRDENLELMDQYLTNGKSRTIPIFIFIDQDGNEVAKWGPLAEKTKQFMDPLKEKLPTKDADNYKEEFTKLITYTAATFRDDTSLWDGVYDSLKQTLSDTI